MSKNKSVKRRGMTIKSPLDVMRISQRIINDVFQDEAQIEYAGKITNLLNTWISAFKTNIEFIEMRELKDKICQLEEQMKQNNQGGNR